MHITERERRAFSLAKVFTAMSSDGLSRSSFESEILESAAAEAGQPFDRNRVYIPLDLLRRDLNATVASEGGYLKQTQIQSPVDILRPFSVTMRAGVTALPGLVGTVPIPKTTAGSTGYWLSESGTITASQPVVTSVSLSPKMCGAFTKYSRLLQLQSVVENMLRLDLLRTIGTLIDKAVLNGGGGTEPTGLLNTAGVGAQSGTSLAWAGILNMESQCATNNGEPAAWIAPPAVRKLLKAREVAAGSGMIWTGDSMNGKSALATTEMPAATLATGAWASMVLGMWGDGVFVEVDPSTGFKSGIYAMRVLAGLDVGVLDPAAFSVATIIT